MISGDGRIEIHLPPDADPMVVRVLTSPKLHGVTWADLNSTVSFADLVMLNDTIDAIEAAEALARKGA